MKIKSFFLLALFACSMACFNGCQEAAKSDPEFKKKEATEADIPAADRSEKTVQAPPA